MAVPKICYFGNCTGLGSSRRYYFWVSRSLADSLSDVVLLSWSRGASGDVKEAGSAEILNRDDADTVQPTEPSPLDPRKLKLKLCVRNTPVWKSGNLELAESNGIDITSLLRKSEYIDALIHHELGEKMAKEADIELVKINTDSATR